MERIKLGDRWIGKGHPCFITVDIGSNHNKDFNIAKKLIDKAVDAGVDAVKFQIYSAETLYSKNVPKHTYYKKNLWQLIKDIETPREWIPELKKYCDKKKVMFFATPFDIKAVDELDPYVDFHKIASFELVDLPLIRYVASKKKPIVISTGLATIQEIKDAYSACVKAGNKKIVLLQCASVYPAKPDVMNLKAMDMLGCYFDVPVGLSDHTHGTHISVAAVAMGACFIEKHFTLDKTMDGPDHPFAMDPEELENLVSHIREAEKAFGDGKKKGPSNDEIENYRIGRRSIHALVDIPKGTKITKDMLSIKRPGFGILPKYLEKLIGKKAKRNISSEEWITWEMV